MQEFKSELAKTPTKEVIFFASWCASCKKHLSDSDASRSDRALVAIFDEQPSAEAVLRQFAMKHPKAPRCYWDKDGSIASFYEVKSLPASRLLD